MAVGTPTLKASGSRTTGASSDTTASFTPTANAVLWAFFHGRNASGAPASATISDTAGLTWTSVFTASFNSANRIWIGWAVAPSSPSSMTVTASWGATVDSGAFGVFETTGANTTTPVVASSNVAAGSTSTTPASGTVPAMASSGNLQILFVASRSSSSTAEASWAEVFDVVASGQPCHASAYYIGTPGDTSPTATLPGSAVWRASALEVAAGGLTLAASGSQVATEDGTPTYAGAFNAFRGLVLKWP